jgi:hypothetical protein
MYKKPQAHQWHNKWLVMDCQFSKTIGANAVYPISYLSEDQLEKLFYKIDKYIARMLLKSIKESGNYDLYKQNNGIKS